MDDKELQEFDLEDIIKEFSDAPEQTPEDAPEEQAEVQEENPEAEQTVPGETAVPATEDTVRFEAVSEQAAQAVTSDTIRLETIPDMQGKVHTAAPIGEEPEEEKTEPFSSEWEPEYDQPIAEYVPAAPIVFHPKSRLRELKRKLVAGPERQYYQLTEKGFGKLQAAIFFSVLLVLISAIATALYALDMVQPERMRLMVFVQFWVMLVSALLGSYQLLEGVLDLFRRKFSLNTLLLFTFVLCCVDGVLCLKQLRVPCCAAFSVQVTMSLWSAYQRRNTKLGQLDTMRKATRLDSIYTVDDYHEENKGLLRGEGEVEHFMDTYEDTDSREKILSVYALVALLVSLGIGIFAGVLYGISTGIQVAAVTTLAAMPASMFVILSRPMAVLERRLHAVGAVLCGWQGARDLAGKKTVFPLDHSDLFPAGSVKMNGVKFFGSRQPDEIIAYATALICANGGTLEPLFTHLLDSRNGVHYQTENFTHYDEGIGGEVAGEAVLAGTLAFLKRMGVEVPEGIRVSQAVCVAVDGELCGLFAVTYDKERSAAAGITSLCGYRNLKPVLMTGDFMLTPKFIHSHFGVNTKRIVFTDAQTRQELLDKQPQEVQAAPALITGEGLAPFAYAVTGARSLRTAINMGITIHLIGGILGMVMMLVLAFLGAIELLTPANMFLYELIWMIPGLLVTEWTRNI